MGDGDAVPQRTRFSSSDPFEIRAHLDEVYGWRPRTPRPAPFDRPLTVETVAAGGVVVARAVAPGDLDYRVAGQDFVVVCTLLQGEQQLERGTALERYGPGDVCITNSPESDFASSTHDTQVATATIPAHLIDEVASDLPEEVARPVRFLSFVPIAGDSRRWREASRFVDRLLRDPTASTEPLITGPAARHLVAAALATFPSSALDAPTRSEQRDVRPALLRRAIAFIEANPDVDISITDVARAARSTPQAVSAAFRRHLDSTPAAHLRRVRLDRASADLTAATEGETVQSIARRWGYALTQAFADDYRAEYGRAPEEDLLHSWGG